MKKRFKLGVIGCGFMAKAILKGAVLSDFLSHKKILVSDINEKMLDEVDELGVSTTNDNRFLVENCEYVLFAVKPQVFETVIEELDGYVPEKVISIMAGVKIQKIKNCLGVGAKVARCMPNLPCSIGSGMVGVDMSDFYKSHDDTDFITNLFDCLGTVLNVTEEKMDAVTGISGSGPAYVFMFIDALVDAGIQQGLTKAEARVLAVQTVIGGAEMVMKSEKPITELVMNVCSKGGTTIEAVKVFQEMDMHKMVSCAVDACVKRSKELSK